MNEELERALQSFNDWDMPWLFREQVLKSISTHECRQLFEAVWSEAVAEVYWKSSDLAACARHAEAGLQRAFPRLSSEAVAALANAAAYQWK
jgi:hypothetical protein